MVHNLVLFLVWYFGVAQFGIAQLHAQKPVEKRPQPATGAARVAAGKAADRLAQELKPRTNAADVFQALDYSKRSKLGVINRLLAEANYEDATRMLGDLLSQSDSPQSDLFEPEDYFLHSDGGISLKQYIQRRLGAMPEAARRLYEFRYGTKARKLLSQGIADRDMSLLQQASRRYFHTQAGYQATLLLARHHMNQSRPLAAALCFRRLLESPAAGQFEPMLSVLSAVCFLRAGMTDRASETLIALKKRQGAAAAIVVAGRGVPLFTNDANAVAWLKRTIGPQLPVELARAEGWTIFRGSPSRNANNRGDGPLMRRRWQAMSYVNESEKTNLLLTYQKYLANRQAALPALHPLAVRTMRQGKPHDIVLYRTLRHLMGVDFKSGKIIWFARTTYGDEDPSVGDEEDDMPLMVNRRFGRRAMQPQGVGVVFDQRMWEDAAYGTISSDGTYVFAVEDLGFIQNRYGSAPGRGRKWTDELGHNRLSARSLAIEGKLKWQLGVEQSRPEPKLSGAFFLGPPLPVEGTLYAIIEINREIRLVALAPDTGKLLWQQQLMPVKRLIGQAPLRRKAGATASFANGVLVCPTSAGAVVAIDLATRSLLWGYHYGQPSRGKTSPWNMRPYDDQDSQKSVGKRWADATVTIAEGRVLITPVESKEIHCLNLLDGSRAWPSPRRRDANLYVGCVYQGIVLLVGTDQAVGLRLEDGSPAFTIALAREGNSGGCLPSGRGFQSDGHYFLPTTTGEILKIDIAQGKIIQRARARDGHILGNLICFEGNVISLGVNGLESFYQITPLRERVDERLAKDAGDPWALARLGEIKHSQGHLAEAIDCFRRSYQTANQDQGLRFHTGQMLAISLIDALQSDFAANRHSVEEVERLVDLTEHRGRFERAMAVGLGAAGETLAAFDVYMQIYDQPRGSAALERLGQHRQVRKDRWVRGHLKDLYEAAGPFDRGEMDLAIAARLRDAMRSGAQPVSRLRRFVNYLGEHPLADQARLALAVQLTKSGDFLAAEQMLLPAQRSADRPTAGAALTLVARLMIATDHPRRAADCYRRLSQQYGDVVCLDGETGQQLYQQWSERSATVANPEIQKLVATNGLAEPRWPKGMVHAGKPVSQPTSDRPTQRIFDLVHRGPRGPFFKNITLQVDRSLHQVIGRDPLGHISFSIELTSGDQDQGIGDPLSHHARNSGHLLVVSSGNQIYFLNTLNDRLDPSERLLWTQSLTPVESSDDYAYINYRRTRRYERAIQRNMPWGETRYQALDSNRLPIGTFSIAGDDAVCYQIRRTLFCVDPLSGDRLWTTGNIPAGCELFGDGQIIVAVPPKGNEALLLRSIDGELLGERTIASQLQRICTLGRRIVCWREIDGQLHVALLDPWTGEYLWKVPIATGSKGRLVSAGQLAVMEPGGRFRLLLTASGRALIDQQLDSEKDAHGISQLRRIYWMPGVEDDILVVDRNRDPSSHKLPGSKSRIEWAGVSGDRGSGSHAPLVAGKIYSFDRQSGKPRWQVPGQIAYEGLVLNQPRALPVLVFVRHNISDTNKSRTDRDRATSSILCLDRRTGRVVGRFTRNAKNTHNVAYNMQISGNPANNTVTLAVPKLSFPSSAATPVWSVTLKLTDEPIPPGPPIQLGDRKPRPPLDPVGFFKKLFGG